MSPSRWASGRLKCLLVGLTMRKMSLRRIAPLLLVLALFPISRFDCRHGDEKAPAEPKAGKLVPDAIAAKLIEAGWDERVEGGLGLWVSAARQELIGIRGDRVEFVYLCSTAARGMGNRENSNQTPTGWHKIEERIGGNAPWGTIFVERKSTGKTWATDQVTEKDYVLTRIMWLRGLEPGINAGPGVDSHDRYIYIHGTPAEDKIGTPASMGCIRLRNDDVITLFETVESGTPVLMTEW